MKIAIVGAGVAGLTAAYRLRRDHEVTVYEARERLGGHTHTVTVDEQGTERHIDTGFIVYNDRNYPRFCALLAELGVATQPSDMSFGVCNAGSGLAYSGAVPRGLFAQRRRLLSPAHWRFLAGIVAFGRAAKRALVQWSAARLAEYDLGAFLAATGAPQSVRDNYVVPMASAIWSTPAADIAGFPLEPFLRFFDNHGLLDLTDRPQWRVLRGGSSSYLGPLAKRSGARCLAGRAVTAVEPAGDGVTVVTAAGETRYDRVVLACHSDTALALQPRAAAEVRAVLAALPYRRNSVVLHTDERVLPAARDAWASWNYFVEPQRPDGAPGVSYWMNRLQSIDSDVNYIVTLNRDAAIAPERVLRRLSYSHPQFSPAGFAAQRRWAQIDGGDRIHYCGAYWGYGFHEDAVVSAERVAATIDGR